MKNILKNKTNAWIIIAALSFGAPLFFVSSPVAEAATAGTCFVANGSATPVEQPCTEQQNNFEAAANGAAAANLCYSSSGDTLKTVAQVDCAAAPPAQPGECKVTTNPRSQLTPTISACNTTTNKGRFREAAEDAGAALLCYRVNTSGTVTIARAACGSGSTDRTDIFDEGTPTPSSQTSPGANGGSTNLGAIQTGDQEGDNTCGSGSVSVKTSFNFGCKGTGNAIVDLLFSLFRFLSVGVGIVCIGSIVVAGIQYSASQGDPNATKAAIKRATNTVMALVLYFLIYAIIEWLVPGGLFNSSTTTTPPEPEESSQTQLTPDCRAGGGPC